jgi:hypothetical protein
MSNKVGIWLNRWTFTAILVLALEPLEVEEDEDKDVVVDVVVDVDVDVEVDAGVDVDEDVEVIEVLPADEPTAPTCLELPEDPTADMMSANAASQSMT